MSQHADLLVEIGTEELPPGSLGQLAEALHDQLLAELDKAQLLADDSTAQWFATPRRLAVRVTRVADRQADRDEQRLGPAVAAAFDGEGNPSPAALGFARSCGVEVSELERIATDKGERLGIAQRVDGVALADLLPEILGRCCSALPIPRPMRWGASEETFVRPVHWVVALHGERVVPGQLFGQAFGRLSHGHRFHHSEPVSLARPADYERELESAFVLVDTGARAQRIATQAKALVQGDARVVIREALLTEVANLCEWPVALLGQFDAAFLDVPAEALVSSMEKHQRFFPVVDGDGALLPTFVAIANLESRDPGQVKTGFERVITPRLADARFFWQQDLKTPLDQLGARLDRVVYQKQLGSLGDKVDRVATLAAQLAKALGEDESTAATAARLSKSDLVSQMVGEFPELQGIMGRYYAQAQGLPEAVCQAIEQHYLPRFAGDQLPAAATGRILAVADRVDTLCGIFAAGMKPSGNRDPFALRRGALGLVRILVECQLDLDLAWLLEQGFAGVARQVSAPQETRDLLLEFIMERMRAYYADQGLSADVFEAVWARRPTRLLDFHRRVEGLVMFRKMDAASALAAANKRIGNLLRKADGDQTVGVDPSLFVEPAEVALHEALLATATEVAPRLAKRDYSGALQALAGLRETVDGYFDGVMVMAEETPLRINRLSLLADVKALFDDIADISQLKVAS